MKLLFDFFPILVFFITFKFFGIYTATAMTMAASGLQVLLYWLKHRKFESLHVITLVIVLLFGSSTLLLHNDLFIKWKPTAIYWIFAIVFLGSHFISKKPLIQKLLDNKMSLPSNVWSRLNISWVLFFAIMGVANIYVLYHFSTNAWVNFKLFGTLGLTIVFLVLQAVYMAKYMDTKNVAGKTLVKNIPKHKPSNDEF